MRIWSHASVINIIVHKNKNSKEMKILVTETGTFIDTDDVLAINSSLNFVTFYMRNGFVIEMCTPNLGTVRAPEEIKEGVHYSNIESYYEIYCEDKMLLSDEFGLRGCYWANILSIAILNPSNQTVTISCFEDLLAFAKENIPNVKILKKYRKLRIEKLDYTEYHFEHYISHKRRLKIHDEIRAHGYIIEEFTNNKRIQ